MEKERRGQRLRSPRHWALYFGPAQFSSRVSRPWAIARLESWPLTQKNGLRRLLARAAQVEGPVKAPSSADSKRDVGLPKAHAAHRERADEIEQHAREVRDE